MLDEAAARVLDAQTGILKSGDWCGQPTEGTRTSGNKIYGKKRSLPYFYKGDSGGASRFFYCAKASRRERGAGNNHPTVKPLDLMCYLCRLVTPKGGHVLDPFMGSGSTGVACQREGFDFTGIELTVEYLQIAKQRMLPKK
jgi:site-specific DNA-methyltransferase (adenine-specific)